MAFVSLDGGMGSNRPGEQYRRKRKLPPPSPWEVLERPAIGALVAATLFATGAYWLRHRGQLIEIDRAPRLALHFQLDINRAEWPELSLLPEIGETRAKQIVAARKRHGFFASHDDLRRVPGIGPATLERIRPYLLPLPTSKAVAGTPPAADGS